MGAYLIFNQVVAGSNPVCVTIKAVLYITVTSPVKREVVGSSPTNIPEKPLKVCRGVV